MKLLINLCAHDGIISYYTGVGTMVNRYIDSIIKILNDNNIDYDLNLFTPEYNTDSFGYNKLLHEKHRNLNIKEVSNGSFGSINYGSIKEWKLLSLNTAFIINSIDKTKYDKVLTIYNDTPYACLSNYLKNEDNHIKVWIPHSTVKIHVVDSAIENSIDFYNDRLEWEMNAVKYINNDKNSYLGCICDYVKEHLINEYFLDRDKAIDIYNGEILEDKNYNFSSDSYKILEEINKFDRIVLSFSRAEEYKNLEGTMYLGKELGFNTVVITQYYYKNQPILKDYEKISKITNTNLYISPPFDLAKCILKEYNKDIILVVPSKKEVMGLIINETRKLNKDNILIVANSVGGLKEQIDDTVNGLLVDMNDIKSSALKIKKYYTKENMIYMNKNSQILLREKYDFNKNMKEFLMRVGVL